MVAGWNQFVFKSTGFTSSTFPIQPDFSQNQPAAITLNTGSPRTLLLIFHSRSVRARSAGGPSSHSLGHTATQHLTFPMWALGRFPGDYRPCSVNHSSPAPASLLPPFTGASRRGPCLGEDQEFEACQQPSTAAKWMNREGGPTGRPLH
jgi:hypothetical protein